MSLIILKSHKKLLNMILKGPENIDDIRLKFMHPLIVLLLC